MKRIDILILLFFTVSLTVLLSFEGTINEGLKNVELPQKNIEKENKKPDEGKAYDFMFQFLKNKTNVEEEVNATHIEKKTYPKTQEPVYGPITSLKDQSALLQEMSPTWITDTMAESQYPYRWIAGKWGKCKDVCGTEPVSRTVKCFKRNNMKYADDLPIEKLYTIEAEERDEFGNTVCDNKMSGIQINVRPQDESFCSLVHGCTNEDLRKEMTSKIQPDFKFTPKKAFKYHYIGFQESDLKKIANLKPSQKQLVLNAFDKTETVTETQPANPDSVTITKYLFTDKTRLKTFMDSLTQKDRSTLTDILKFVKITTRAENKYDSGEIVVL